LPVSELSFTSLVDTELSLIAAPVMSVAAVAVPPPARITAVTPQTADDV